MMRACYSAGFELCPPSHVCVPIKSASCVPACFCRPPLLTHSTAGQPLHQHYMLEVPPLHHALHLMARRPFRPLVHHRDVLQGASMRSAFSQEGIRHCEPGAHLTQPCACVPIEEWLDLLTVLTLHAGLRFHSWPTALMASGLKPVRNQMACVARPKVVSCKQVGGRGRGNSGRMLPCMPCHVQGCGCSHMHGCMAAHDVCV